MLDRYRREESTAAAEGSGAGGPKGGEDEGEEGAEAEAEAEAEETEVDRVLVAFQRRMAAAPAQCVRYYEPAHARNAAVEPVWVSAPCAVPRKCSAPEAEACARAGGVAGAHRGGATVLRKLRGGAAAGAAGDAAGAEPGRAGGAGGRSRRGRGGQGSAAPADELRLRNTRRVRVCRLLFSRPGARSPLAISPPFPPPSRATKGQRATLSRTGAGAHDRRAVVGAGTRRSSCGGSLDRTATWPATWRSSSSRASPPRASARGVGTVRCLGCSAPSLLLNSPLMCGNRKAQSAASEGGRRTQGGAVGATSALSRDVRAAAHSMCQYMARLQATACVRRAGAAALSPDPCSAAPEAPHAQLSLPRQGPANGAVRR